MRWLLTLISKFIKPEDVIDTAESLAMKAFVAKANKIGADVFSDAHVDAVKDNIMRRAAARLLEFSKTPAGQATQVDEQCGHALARMFGEDLKNRINCTNDVIAEFSQYLGLDVIEKDEIVARLGLIEAALNGNSK